MSHNIINVEPVRGMRQSFGGDKFVPLEFTIISDREMCLIFQRKVMNIEEKLEDIIFLLKKQPLYNNAPYLKTIDMAQNLSVSKSFLEKRMYNTFQEGKHFHKGIEARLLRWNVAEMYQWLQEKKESEDELLAELLDSL